MKRMIALVLSLILVLLLLPFGNAESMDKYIRMPGGVTAEMLSADFWAGESADEVLMTPEEISAIPENDLNRLLAKADALTAESVRSDIRALGQKDPAACYLNGKNISKKYLNDLMENANPDGVDPAMPLRYGYSVARASLRSLPTNDFLGESPDDLFFDKMVNSECMPYLPVIVAHVSRDGEWYFVYFYGFGGWVEKKNIALCPSRGDWLKRQKASEFLLVTAREIRLNVDRGCDELSGQLLPMGTKLPLLSREEAPAQVAGRESFLSYVVNLPIRGENGMIQDVTALIPMSDDVHVGYLPLTSRNILNQVFKLLGDRYGWAGLDYSNDCSGTVREVYRCFGIELLRTASEQARSSFGTSIDLSEFTPVEKMDILSALIPGSLLFFPGHIMLYLGMKDDIPCVISSVGSFAEEDMEVGTVLHINTVTVNSLMVHRRDGSTWLDNLTQIVSPVIQKAD